ncbi:hypothetical protein EIK77_009513 [Talaromyces pinophilus]|nr:hypothetical protein EIK77_009513 [Talaromyces pinophilus]PCH06776.1 Hypothetical protein PENO1_015400 [Penicillium occitanis (nom. inval.)]PCH07748.1 hypothetical protein PENOC_017560 [Penicillium occitanis (nom. inval.)]
MDDIHSTAKWANRMLRPLTSLYHRLGKHSESINAQEEEINKIVAAATNTEYTKPDASGDAEHDSEFGDQDPSWIPRNPESKRVKHKYVARGERLRLQPRARVRSVLQSPEATKTLPGAIEIATPLITGKSTNTFSTNNKAAENGRQQDGHNLDNLTRSLLPDGIAEKIVRRPKKYRPSHPDPKWRQELNATNLIKYFDIVISLEGLFLKFLEKTRSTDSTSKSSTNGTRSLLMTIIRRLPEFIAEEQRLQDELDNNDEIDMADAYFTELESAYGTEGKGWQPLREAVRSQGIFLICDMLQKNWINQLTTTNLLYHCINAKENDAVERILSVLLSKVDRYNFPCGFNPWRPDVPGRDPIRLLQRYWQVSGNNSYVFKEIELLLLRNILPPEWLVTITLKDCVIAACTSQSKWDDEYAAAIKLMKTILITAADAHKGRKVVKKAPVKKRTKAKKQTQDSSNSQANGLDVDQGRCPVHLQDATSNLISSLNVALCCMYGVRMGQPDGPDYISGERIVKTYTDLALTIQHSLPLSGFEVEDNEASRASLLRKGYTFLAHFVLRSQQDLLLLKDTGVEILDVILSQDCEPFFGLLEQNADIIKNLSAMVCQIVRLSERGDEQAQCRQARRLCKHLLKYERFGLERLTFFLGKIAIEVALDFAQYSQDAEDHTFAADIQEAVATIRRRIKSKSNCAPTPGKSSMQSFRWEEGIGEWIAKTPLDRTKAAMTRVLSQPMVEINLVGVPSSTSASSPSSSIGSESSKTSMASPGLVSLKRRRTSVVSTQPNVKRVKRPRRIYKKKVYKKIRQSTRIATRLSDLSVVTRGEDHDHFNIDSDYESDYEEDDADAEAASESEERLPQTETGDISDAVQDTRDVGELQGSVANAQAQRMRANFDVIIHNAATAPVPAVKRGRGRPRKQVAGPTSSASQANGPQAHANVSRGRPVIPCSEDDGSDDELSFL